VKVDAAGKALEIAGRHRPGPVLVPVAGGEAALVSAGRPSGPADNEDAAALVPIGAEGVVLVVADGIGGQRGGELASAAVVHEVVRAVRRAPADESAVRGAVIDGIEAANEKVLAAGLGAGATVMVAVVWARRIRTIHAGDAQAIVTGQRGRLKLETTAHSPVGVRQAQGLLDEAEALAHEDRHLVTNAVGDRDMTVEVGMPLTLAAHDTVVLGSDGLFDNLRLAEIVNHVRVGPLGAAATRLREAASDRMAGEQAGEPSKPDDLTFILYRPGRRRAGRA
jgi:serine/threonine protein phosphatase PrpC